jgi:hypothetical protein
MLGPFRVWSNRIRVEDLWKNVMAVEKYEGEKNLLTGASGDLSPWQSRWPWLGLLYMWRRSIGQSLLGGSCLPKVCLRSKTHIGCNFRSVKRTDGPAKFR